MRTAQLQATRRLRKGKQLQCQASGAFVRAVVWEVWMASARYCCGPSVFRSAGALVVFELGHGKHQPRVNAYCPLGDSGVQRRADNPCTSAPSRVPRGPR